MQAVYTNAKERKAAADLSSRLVALLIDAFLLLAIISAVDYFTISSDESVLLLKPERILDFLLGWLYFAGTETCACQGTMGKHIMNLQVVAHDGSRLTFGRASIRYFTKPVTLLVLLMRFLVGAGLPQLPLLHDKLANSRVVPR